MIAPRQVASSPRPARAGGSAPSLMGRAATDDADRVGLLVSGLILVSQCRSVAGGPDSWRRRSCNSLSAAGVVGEPARAAGGAAAF